MAIDKGTAQSVDRREHDLDKYAKRMVLVDPFGGITTLGNFTLKIDEASSTVTYVGVAQIGTPASDSLWQIKRITIASSLTSIEWAGGSDSFTNSWDDRASLTYS